MHHASIGLGGWKRPAQRRWEGLRIIGGIAIPFAPLAPKDSEVNQDFSSASLLAAGKAFAIRKLTPSVRVSQIGYIRGDRHDPPSRNVSIHCTETCHAERRPPYCMSLPLTHQRFCERPAEVQQQQSFNHPKLSRPACRCRNYSSLGRGNIVAAANSLAVMDVTDASPITT